jgi:hypothetical protein
MFGSLQAGILPPPGAIRILPPSCSLVLRHGPPHHSLSASMVPQVPPNSASTSSPGTSVLEHLHQRPQNGGRQGAGRPILGAPACPPKILGPGSHTGGSKMPPKKLFNINVIQIAIYMFMKCKYNIVYTN